MKLLVSLLSIATLACAVSSSLSQSLPTATAIPPTATPTPACQELVTATHLNLRTCAGTYCSVRAVLDNGHAVHLRSFSGGWYFIDTMIDGQLVTGFVREGYVSTCD